MFCLIKKNNSIPSGIDKYVLHENEEYYYLPRHIYRYFNTNSIIKYRDESFTPKKADKFNFTSTLRPAQKQMCGDYYDFYEKHGYFSGIAHARPGSGKTILGIYLAYATQMVTLIVIDNRKIVSQWKEEILAHTDLDESDIGIIKGDEFDVEDKTIIITTPQTLSSKFKNHKDEYYPKIKAIGIGLVVWDEAHKIADKWATGLFMLNTPNVIGLTATPYHDKDKEILMHSLFGEVVTKFGSYDFSPFIKYINFESGVSNKLGYVISKMWETNFNAGRAKYNATLTSSEAWKTLCGQAMIHGLKDPNNRMIVIVFTKKQLEMVYGIADELGLNPTKLYSKENDIDKDSDMLIIATQKFASEAFDYPQLNRLLLAVPLLGKKSLIQTIGRILRACDGKSDAVVYDLIDMCPSIKGIFSNAIQQKTRILNNEYDDLQYEIINAKDII